MKYSICILLAFSMNACLFYSKKVNSSDIKTTGFLTPACFQVIIQEKADVQYSGLVAKRSSSLIKAKKKMKHKIINSLYAYTIRELFHKNAIINLKPKKYKKKSNKIKTDTQRSLQHKKLAFPILKKYLKNGYIAYVYYKEDKSAVIVYRIVKYNLKKKLHQLREQLLLMDIKNKKQKGKINQNK